MLSGPQIILPKNEVSVHIQHDTKTIQILRSTNIGMLNLYVKHSTKFKTVANVQDNSMWPCFGVINI